MTPPLEARQRERLRTSAVGALLSLPDRVGRYIVRGELGRGGMGIVYDAWDPELDRYVAVKVVRPDRVVERPHAEDAPTHMLERFTREMRATSGVFDPHLVAILDAGIDTLDGEQRPFFVMERVDGESLEERLLRVGVPAPDEALELIVAVARGLAAVHRAGLVHRDLKPSNVLLPANGAPRVTDFGLCLRPCEVEIGADQIVGSAHAIAPEQIGGAEVDARADLFALGAMLVTLHAGRPPFEASSLADHLDRIRRAAPDGLHQLPEDLRPLATRLLAKSPGDRPRSAEDVVAELVAIRGQRALRHTHHRSAWLVVLAAGALAGIALAAGLQRELTRLDEEVMLRRRQVDIQMARARDLLPMLRASSPDATAPGDEERLVLRDELSGITNRIAVERQRLSLALAERDRRRRWLPWTRLGASEAEPTPAGAGGSASPSSGAEGDIEPRVREEIERQLELLERELGVRARLLVEPRADGISIEEWSRQRFAELAGAETGAWDHGLLFWIDRERGDARIETGYALESVLPDPVLGQILRDVRVAAHASGDVELAWRLALRVVRHRLRSALLRGELAPFASRRDLAAAGGGGGATLRDGSARPFAGARLEPHEREAFAPGATPAEALARYRAWLEHGRFDAEVTLFTEASRELVAGWPATQSYRRTLLALEPREARRIVLAGDAALAFATHDPLAPPRFLRRDAAGWRIDLEADRRHVLGVAGGGYAWSLRRVDQAPLVWFEDTLVVVDGLIRVRGGDNRRAAPGLLAGASGDGGRAS